jgi:hypothetical protein
MAVAIVAGVSFLLLKGCEAKGDEEPTGSPSNSKSPILIGALRIVRGIFGLIGAVQLIGLLPALSWFSRDAIYHPDFMHGVALFFGKFVIASICIGLFFFMRKLINRIHAEKTGSTAIFLLSKWQL